MLNDFAPVTPVIIREFSTAEATSYGLVTATAAVMNQLSV